MDEEQIKSRVSQFNKLDERYQELYNKWTRIDIARSQVADDLQVANGRIEQLTTECANLRAEKNIWEVSI